MTNASGDDRSERSRIVRPVFIISTPRSGSTLLFETLVKAPGLFSPGDESHMRIEQVADFFPGRRGWSSNRLTVEDASWENVEALATAFNSGLRDRDGSPPAGPVRMLEKTPKNALRIPFFNAAWPDSLFVYLYRDARQTLASMIEAWALGRFVTYPMLPGWGRPPWSLLLVPGWQDLIGKRLPEIVAYQWSTTTNMLIDDLQSLAPERVVGVDHAEFLENPQALMTRLTQALDLGWDIRLPAALPLSRYTFTRPAPDKWRRFEKEIERVFPSVADTDARARDFLAKVRC